MRFRLVELGDNGVVVKRRSAIVHLLEGNANLETLRSLTHHHVVTGQRLALPHEPAALCQIRRRPDELEVRTRRRGDLPEATVDALGAKRQEADREGWKAIYRGEIVGI